MNMGVLRQKGAGRKVVVKILTAEPAYSYIAFSIFLGLVELEFAWSLL